MLSCSVTSHKTVCPTCQLDYVPTMPYVCVHHQQGMKVSWVLAWSFVDDVLSFSLRLISPSNSLPILSCTTTCHIGVFPTCHIFLCPHQHMFLCRCNCYNLTIELTAFLSCITTCHICVFLTCHIFLCPHRHIFLCCCHCYRSLVLASLPPPVVVLVPSPMAHVMSFIGRWIL